jgi:hypothetical protein
MSGSPRARGEIDLRRVGYGGALIAAAVLLALLITRGLLALFGAGVADRPAAVRELPPAPRLEVHPREDFAHFRSAEAAKLSAYHWVDRDAGIVAIPIERAMALLAAAGEAPRRAPNGPPDSGAKQ